MRNNETPTLPPLLVDARGASRMLCIGERALWSKTKSGEIPHLRIGRSVRYSVSSLERFVAEREEGGDSK